MPLYCHRCNFLEKKVPKPYSAHTPVSQSINVIHCSVLEGVLFGVIKLFALSLEDPTCFNGFHKTSQH